MFNHLQKYLLLLLAFISPLLSEQLAKEAPTSEAAPVIVLGGGIGALTSAIYLERGGIETIVIEGRTPGGAIAQSPLVQNWPGEVEIDGQALIDKVRYQAEVNGAKILSQEVIEVDFSKKPFKIVTRDLTTKDQPKCIFYTNSCIIATGSDPKLLGVPGETEYWTRGVYTCATCDGALFRNKTVAVVGGGDTAILEAEYLSKIAKKIILVVRGSNFRTTETLRKKSLLKQENVEVLFNTVVESIEGAEKAERLVLRNGDQQKKLDIDGVFLAIGSTPNSRLFQGQLELDKAGYIVLKSTQETSRKGIFAIGDVVDPTYKQAISAAGDGAKAALQLERYLTSQNLVPPSSLHKEAPPLFVKKLDPVKKSQVATKEEDLTPPSDLVVAANNNTSQVLDLKDIDQLSELLQTTSIPVLVDFYSPYCGPCREISPIVEKSSITYEGKIKFIKANISEVKELASDYNIFSVPTVIVFNKQGKEVDRKTGRDPIISLLNSLDKFVEPSMQADASMEMISPDQGG